MAYTTSIQSQTCALIPMKVNSIQSNKQNEIRIITIHHTESESPQRKRIEHLGTYHRSEDDHGIGKSPLITTQIPTLWLKMGENSYINFLHIYLCFSLLSVYVLHTYFSQYCTHKEALPLMLTPKHTLSCLLLHTSHAYCSYALHSHTLYTFTLLHTIFVVCFSFF